MSKRRHRKHRESSIFSDKRKTVYTVLIWVGAAVFSLLIALLIGNALGKQADKIKSKDSLSAFSYTYNGDSVPPIKAYFLNISNQTDSSLEATINALTSDVSAVSLYLRQGNGAPVYYSTVANAVLNKSGSFDLSAAVSLLRSKEIYVSACFDCNSFSVSDESARNAAIALEAAMIAEALNAGIDDVVVCGLPVTDTEINYVAKLFSEIRKIKSDAILGAGIDYKNILSESGASALKKYSEFADFCAIDAESANRNGTSSESVADSLLYVFEIYPLRLMISISGEVDFASQVEKLNALGITNIQAYKYESSSAAG